MKNIEYHCELLTAIIPSEALGYIEDPRFLMQEKVDDFRITIEYSHWYDRFDAYDRYGQPTSVPDHIKASLRNLFLIWDFDVDGGLMGLPGSEYLIVWDLLSFGCSEHDSPYIERWRLLQMVFDNMPPCEHVHLVNCWPCGATDTLEHFRDVHNRGGEGVCFKDTLAIFQRGRAGQHFKLKFWETATCRVADKSQRADARADKHSVALELCCDRGDWLPMGFVTIPSAMALPTIGTLVEVRYLYAQPTGLYQPTFLGVRKDAREQDCRLAQLKWQRTEEEIRRLMVA